MSVLSLFYGFCTVQNVWLSELYKVHDIIGVVEGWRGGNLPFMSLPPLLLKGGRKWPQIYGKLWYKCLQMAEIGKNLQIIITNNEKTDKISFETPLWEIAPPQIWSGYAFLWQLYKNFQTIVLYKTAVSECLGKQYWLIQKTCPILLHIFTLLLYVTCVFFTQSVWCFYRTIN